MADSADPTCRQCGYVNLSGSEVCRNCKAPLPAPGVVAKRRSLGCGTWLLVAVVTLGAAAAWLQTEAHRYSIIARVSEGPLIASTLQSAIDEARSNGSTDFTCDQTRCTIMASRPQPARTVVSVRSDRGGRITVEFQDPDLPPDQSRLVLSPMIEGHEVDLSDAATAGKAIEWRCGATPQTTVPARLRPSRCR